MDRQNAQGLRRLLKNLRGKRDAHAQILKSLPFIPSRAAWIDHSIRPQTERDKGRQRLRQVGDRQESL